MGRAVSLWARAAGLIALALAAKLALAAPPVMNFELPMIDGSKFVRLADFEAKPVLLNFWGSECPPCAREIPLLNAQALAHPGLPFIGIAVDDRAAAERFLARLRPGYLQLIARQQPEVLMRRFGNRLGALPYTVLLDAKHGICAARVGEVDAAWLEAAIKACAGPT